MFSFFRRKEFDYFLKIEIENKNIDLVRHSRLLLNASNYYLGQFKVYKNGLMIRNNDDKPGIEEKVAYIDLLEPSNIAVISGNNAGGYVHAHFKDGKTIYYTKEKVLGNYSENKI